MPEVTRHLTIAFQVGSLAHQHIGATHDLAQPIDLPDVADERQRDTGTIRPQHFIGVDDAPVRQGDRLAVDEVPPDGAGGHTERLGLLRQKGAARLFTKEVPEATRPAVDDREGDHLEVVVFEHHAGADVDQVNRHRRARAAQHHTEDQVFDAIQRPAPTVDFQPVHGFPPRKGGDQPAQAQNVIEMAVGEQHALQTPEADPAAQNLPLRPFAAIDEKPLVAPQHDLRGQSPLNRRGGGRRAQHHQF